MRSYARRAPFACRYSAEMLTRLHATLQATSQVVDPGGAVAIRMARWLINTRAGQLVTERALPPGGACLETELSLGGLPAGLYRLALYDDKRLLGSGNVVVE